MITTWHFRTASWSKRLEAAAYALVLGGILSIAFVRLLPAINPNTLYLDDQWVGALAKVPTPQIVASGAALPIGFALLCRLSLFLFADPEVALQVVPVALYLGSLGLIAAILFQLSRSLGAGLLAASFMAANHALALHVVRVKQFSADILCILLVVLLSMAYLSRPTLRRLALLCAVAAAGFTVSFMSALVSLIGVPLCVLMAARRDVREMRPRLILCGLFGLTMAAQYFLLVRYQTPWSLYDFWAGYFLPTSSWQDWRRMFNHNGRGVMIQSLPSGFFRLAYVIPVSLLAGVIAHQWSRFLAIVVVLASSGVIVASTLRIIPFGGGRTDLFVIPLITLGLFSGLTSLRFLPESPRRVVSMVLAVAAACMMVFKPIPLVGYLNGGTQKEAVAYAAASAGPDDCVMVFPDAMWLTAFYAPWPYHLVQTGRVAHGFDVYIDRPKTLTIPTGRERTVYLSNVAMLRSDVDAFFNQQRCARVFHIAAQFDTLNRDHVNDLIVSNGYLKPTSKDFNGATVDTFVPRE